VYSDDGRLVVTGNGDGTVLVRDSSTGVTVRALSVPDAVRDVAAGSGGAVAAAQEGGAVAVWGPDGSTATVVEAHRNGDALAVAFRPDGTAVASGGADGSMAVTDTRTGRVEWVLRRPDTSSQPPPAVNDLDWTSDGRFVITADDAGVLAVWDTGTGELVREVSGHAGRATAVDALGDGSRLLSGGIDGVATLRDTATGAEIARVDAQVPVADVSASPDGNRLLIVDIAGNARVVDGRAGRVLRTVVGRGASPLTADFDPTAPDRAVIATRGGAPAIWDVAAGHPNRNPPTTLDMAGDGTTVSAAPDDDAVRLWSPEGRERGSVATGTGGVPAAALTADGQLLVVVDKTGRASLQRLGRPGSPTPLNTAGVTAVAGGPGRRVATSSGSSLTIWDGDSGIPLRVLGPSGGNVRAVAFGPTPDQLISASADGTATVWGADGRPRHVLQLDGVPTTVAWSPGDDTVATAGDDGVVQLWNAGTGQLRSVLRGHRERVNDVAFDATGSRVATVGDDGEVNLWDVRTGDLLTRRPQPTWIYRVRFTPDGRNLLVTSARGNPYLVYLDDRELLDTARARTTRVLTRDECNRFVQPFASCDQE
jgi:WD40 repeat protein